MRISYEDIHTIRKPYKVSALILSGLSCFTLGSSWTMLPAISNILQTDKNWSMSALAYSYLTLIFLIGALISAPTSGSFSHIKGSKTTIILGAFLGFISMGLFSIAYFLSFFWGYNLLLISQFLLGVSISMTLTSVSTYITQLVKDKSSYALLILYACVNLGSFACPAILNFFRLAEIWWLESLSLSIIYFIISLLTAYLSPYITQEHSEGKHKIWVATKSLTLFFWLFALIILLYAINEIAMTAWGVIFLFKVKNFSIYESSLALSMYWLIVMVSQIGIALLTKYIDRRKIYCSLPLFLILGWTGLYFSTSIIAIYIFFIVNGIGNGAMFALTMFFAQKSSNNLFAISSGLIIKSYFIGSMIGTYLIGALYQIFAISINMIIVFICWQSVILAFVTLITMKKTKILHR